MGNIKEPKGIDFIIQSKPLLKEEEREFVAFIEKRKILNKKKKNKILQKQK